MTMDNKQLQQEIRFLILSALDDFSKDLEQKGDGFAAASLPSFLKKRNQPIFFTSPISYWPDRIEMYSNHAPIIDPLPVEPWSGEGLPPVGTVCEHRSREDRNKWIDVKIIAHTEKLASDVAVFEHGAEVSFSSAEYFRPISTPEQIEACKKIEEIGKLTNDIMRLSRETNQPNSIGGSNALAKAMYGAGYRKQATQ